MSNNDNIDENNNEEQQDQRDETERLGEATEPVADKKDSGQINLVVRNQEQHEVHFRVKQTTPLHKLMGAYCSRTGQSLGAVRFLYDGVRLEKNATPEKHGMCDGDKIDAMAEQTGGARIE